MNVDLIRMSLQKWHIYLEWTNTVRFTDPKGRHIDPRGRFTDLQGLC